MDHPDSPVRLHRKDHAAGVPEVGQKVQDQGVHDTLPDFVGVPVFVGMVGDSVLQPLGQVHVISKTAFTHR